MQLQGLPAGNRTRVLWITRPVFYQATEAVADNLGNVACSYVDTSDRLVASLIKPYALLRGTILMIFVQLQNDLLHSPEKKMNRIICLN